MADSPIVFAGAPLDRAPVERRRPEWLAARRADPSARSLVLSERGLWLEDGRLLLVAPDEDAVFLGLDGGRAFFARDAAGAEPARARRRAAGPGGAPRRLCRVAPVMAPPAPLLRQLRPAHRTRGRRSPAPLPGLRRRALPADRSGRHRQGGRRRSPAARPPGPLAGWPLLGPRRVRRAG